MSFLRSIFLGAQTERCKTQKALENILRKPSRTSQKNKYVEGAELLSVSGLVLGLL